MESFLASSPPAWNAGLESVSTNRDALTSLVDARNIGFKARSLDLVEAENAERPCRTAGRGLVGRG